MNNDIRTIIIDDEDHCRSALRILLKWSMPEVIVLAECSSISEAEKQIKSINPDLVFLDIELSEGSGFDLLTKFPKRNFDVVFTTSYDEYALQAFGVNAVDYLLKPIDEEDLVKTLEKIKSKSSQINQKQLEGMLHSYHNKEEQNKKVAFPVSDGLQFIKIEKIVRCESDGSYSNIYLNDGTRLFLSKTLKQVELIINSSLFIRVHNSHLINKSYIKKYIKGKGGQIILDNEDCIPVSRSRKTDFLDEIL